DHALASELATSRGMVVRLNGTDTRAVGNPIRSSGHRTEYGAPPRLGEHTGRVLGGGAK
ncbi:MAG: CoA transferase, partial [Betaproteobacteria bacterium]|nr:CoA transferase [Betaproteobacteria bacterium]